MTPQLPPLEPRFTDRSNDVDRAVVADDDDDTRALLLMALRRDGFEASEARNGNELLECVEALHRQGHDAQVVVSDIGMPECDGVEAARRLREISRTLSIVMVTGSASPDARRAAVEAGVDAVLQKPITAIVLMRAVRLAMGLRAPGGRLSGATFVFADNLEVVS
jgi:CheY-like chemotaxis protein